MAGRQFNKYILYLSLITFLVLYIICFIFLFNKNSEIISFGFLTVFSIFFIFYIIDTFGIYFNNNVFTFTTGYSWFVLFASMAFKITSLILILIMFNGVYSLNKKELVNYTNTAVEINKPFNKQNQKSNIPPLYKDMINEYKILFIINTSLIFVLFFALMYGYSSLNINIPDTFETFMENAGSATFSNFKPLIFPVIMILTLTFELFASGYEVYIGNELYKLNTRRVF